MPSSTRMKRASITPRRWRGARAKSMYSTSGGRDRAMRVKGGAWRACEGRDGWGSTPRDARTRGGGHAGVSSRVYFARPAW